MEKGVQSGSPTQLSGIPIAGTGGTAGTGGNKAVSNGSSDLTLRVV